MSFNDDFMDFIGFMTDGTGEWPDDDVPAEEDDDEEDGSKSGRKE